MRYHGLTDFVSPGIHSLLNSLLNNCKFLWFNRDYDCATTDLVKPIAMGLYNNRLFIINKAVNCHLWCSVLRQTFSMRCATTTANTEDGTRLDVKAQGFDAWVFNPLARTQQSLLPFPFSES